MCGLGAVPHRDAPIRGARARAQWHYGRELGEAAQARAERLIREALRAKGVREAQLAQWPKAHPCKIQVAAEVRARTTVTVRWLAERLSMGARGYLAHLLLLTARSKIDSGPGNQLRLEI